MKKVVRLRNKQTKAIDSYPTITALWEKNGEELGISQQALYNAMSTGSGFWENKKFMVYYDNVDLGRKVWK